MSGWIIETDAAARIGVTRQTLGNWRRSVAGEPPKLREGRVWKKIGASVFFNPKWVEQQEARKQLLNGARKQLLNRNEAKPNNKQAKRNGNCIGAQ